MSMFGVLPRLIGGLYDRKSAQGGIWLDLWQARASHSYSSG